VLDGVDLDVAEGTVFALLGPNGAGKTTIVHILSTLIRADAGTLRVAGHDPARDADAVRTAIGVTGQFAAVDNLLTAEENLIMMADLRRLDLAMTLIGDPRIIFLDEPTTGLDPRSRHTMWEIIRRLVGRTSSSAASPAATSGCGSPTRVGSTRPPNASATMLRRNLRHAVRYPAMIVATVALPVLILLLFNYAYGDALGAGIAGPATGGGDYIDYVAPGILLMAATSASTATAVAVCTDMTEGIINRFRTMAIARSAVLTGHVASSMIQTLVSLVLVIVVALAVGFRPTAGPLEWLAAFGLLALVTLALTWLSAAFGLVTKSVETASNAPLPLQFLPFIGSAIVPTDSMPAALEAFAEYQPFTPIIETPTR
jgi:ABC-2 type transport system permease protein